MQNLPWIVALVALALLATALGTWGWHGTRKTRPAVLPTEWALAARPVFGSDERRVHRLLREALPHHVVLSKLPLVRFCQPTDPGEVRYWHELLGSSHVTFAVCSANGRVLTAIDLESDKSESRRRMQIKQSVLSACEVHYLRCAVDRLPSVAELQLLVPNAAPEPRTPQAGAASGHSTGRAAGHRSVDAAERRAGHTPLWQDSAVLRDTFFTRGSSAESFDEEARSPAPGGALSSPRHSRRPEFLDTDVDTSLFRYRGFEPQSVSSEGDDEFGGLRRMRR